eukprot:gene8885-9836_t
MNMPQGYYYYDTVGSVIPNVKSIVVKEASSPHLNRAEATPTSEPLYHQLVQVNAIYQSADVRCNVNAPMETPASSARSQSKKSDATYTPLVEDDVIPCVAENSIYEPLTETRPTNGPRSSRGSNDTSQQQSSRTDLGEYCVPCFENRNNETGVYESLKNGNTIYTRHGRQPLERGSSIMGEYCEPEGIEK